MKLTDKVINKLQKYYGLATTRHQDNVDEMYKEIWATLHNLSSTDENPNHGNCPTGANSWWSYRRAEAEGIDVTKFKLDYLPLDKDITKALEPIYIDLSSRESLERCKGGNTQNNIEGYNGLLWHFAPKHLHNGFKTIELANFLAVSIFNEGFSVFESTRRSYVTKHSQKRDAQLGEKLKPLSRHYSRKRRVHCTWQV